MKTIDLLIDRITMYRLLLYYLTGLLLVAMFFGAIGTLRYSPLSIALSAGLFIGICYVTNYIFSKVFEAPSNTESSILTGLILSLIISPLGSPNDLTFFGAAAGLAIASKYILSFRHKHIFNPAAIAVVLTSFGPLESASWWVATSVLVPFVIAGGVLIARKIRRGGMVASFLGSALVSISVLAFLHGKDVTLALQQTVLHSALFFLGFVMLTEPWTSPTTKNKRYLYAALVGLLFSPLLHIGNIYSTPEIALILGNVAAFFMSPIMKTKLRLIGRRRYGKRTEDLEFTPDQGFQYKPGQYVEMTLPHGKTDSRGFRRYFTLASSPTEESLHFGIRYYDNSSSFKESIRHGLVEGGISIGQLGGDFTLPDDPSVKVAFIAGGIGITPFRSMAKYLTDTNDGRSVCLLYGERSIEDVAYSDIFEQARKQIGMDTTYVISEGSERRSPALEYGTITADVIRSRVPDYLDRTFYISGPQPMVIDMKEMLQNMGLHPHEIKVDYFSGYA